MMITGRLRAARVLAQAWLAPTTQISRLHFRVLLTDVDLNAHLTNSRYPQIMDLGRLDLLVRSGVARELMRRRQNPVMVESQLRFSRELPLGIAYVLETRAVSVERRSVVFRQRFLVGDREHAVATVKVVLLAQGRVTRPDALASLVADQVQGSSERVDQ